MFDACSAHIRHDDRVGKLQFAVASEQRDAETVVCFTQVDDGELWRVSKHLDCFERTLVAKFIVNVLDGLQVDDAWNVKRRERRSLRGIDNSRSRLVVFVVLVPPAVQNVRINDRDHSARSLPVVRLDQFERVRLRPGDGFVSVDRVRRFHGLPSRPPPEELPALPLILHESLIE